MKKNSSLVALSDAVTSRKFFLALLLAISFGFSAKADTYTWTNGVNTFWTNAGNWTPSGTGTFPTAAGDVADFNVDMSSLNAQNAVLNAPETIGILNIGDTSSGTIAFTITSGGLPDILTFNNNGEGASINQDATAGVDTISVPIALAENLTISNAAANALNLTGSITGSGNLILTTTGTSALGTIVLSGSPVNNAGTIINSGSGVATVTLSGGIGSNVTTINQNSATSALVISTNAINVNSAGTTISSTGTATTVSGGTAGTGALILNDNGAGVITLSSTAGSTINNTGAIINSGTGAGIVTVSGTIGGSVNALTQNSATSALTISGTTNTYTGTTSVLAGTLNFINNGSLGAGTTNILLGNTTGTVNVSLLNGGANWSRNVTVQSGNSGVATIGVNAAITTLSTDSGSITLGNSSAGHGVTLAATTTGTTALNFSGIIADGSGVTSGFGAVTISATTGVIELSGANTFAGGVNLTSGNLSLNSATALGAGALTINGGNLSQVTASNTITNANALVLDQDFSYTGVGSTLNLGNGAVNLGALTNNALGGNTAVNAARIITVSGTTTLTIGGIVSNGTNGLTNSVTKAGTGTLILSGNSLYTGGTTVNAGVLQLGGTQTGSITINSGGTLNNAGLFSTVTAWITSGDITTGSTGDIALTGADTENINFGNDTNLMLGASSNATYSGTITTSGTTVHLGGGGGTLTVTNANVVPTGDNLVIGANSVPTLLTNSAAGTSTGTVAFTGAINVTGTTTVNAGTLNLATTSGALASSAIILNGGTTLLIDNSGGGTPSASFTRAASVTLNNATLTVSGTSTGNSDDVITGALTINSGGANVITVNPATGTNTELSAASLGITGTNSFAFVNGVNLGKAAPAGNTGGGNIMFTTAPILTGSGTTTGGVTVGQFNTGIIAQLVGSITGTLGTAAALPNTFMTYDATTGLRPLATSEFTTAITAGDNILLNATSTGTAVSSTISVNSLLVTGTVTVGIADTDILTDASGAILFTANGGAINASGTTGALAFGANQGVITVNSGVTGATISADINGTNGLVKLGGGTLTLTGTNNYLGTTQILNGAVTVTKTASFGADTSAILLGDVSGSNNTTLTVSGANDSLSRNIIVQGGNTGTAALNANNTGQSYTGTITLGTNGATAGTGIGHNLTIENNNSFGADTISGTIQDATNLAAGTAGTVTYTAIGASPGTAIITVSGSNTYTGGTILAPTANDAGIAVSIGNNNAFGTGTITVNGGSLGGNGHTIANNLILNANLGTIGADGTLTDTGSVLLTGSRTISGGNSHIILTGIVSDSVSGSNDSLTFLSNGGSSLFTADLAGLNTFDGGVTLNSTAGFAMNFNIDNFGQTSAASALGTGTFTISLISGGGSVGLGNGFGIAGKLSTNNAEVWNNDFSVTGLYFDMGTGAVSLGTSPIATRTISVTGNSFETDGVISNGTNATTPTTGLTKTGNGALVLGGNETYTGATILSTGTLQFGNGGTAGSIASSPGSVLTISGTSVVDIDRSDSVTLSSSIIGNSGLLTGSGGFTQTGTGTLTIANALTYTGTTTVNGGGTLDLAATTGSLNGSTGTALTFNQRGGIFVYDNTGSTGTDSQGMLTLTTSAGENTVASISGTSGADTLTFSNLATRSAGATLNFVTTITGTSVTNKIALTSINGTLTSSGSFTNKLINVGDFFDGSSYAATDSNGTVRAYNYSGDVGGSTSAGGASISGTNVQITGNVTAQTSTTLNTLNITGTNTVAIASGNTLTLAGILKTATGTSSISGGTLAIGTEGVIRTDQATDILTISSTISGTALTKSGAGILILSGTNTYTSTTTLDAGTLDINNFQALGTGTSTFLINAGTTIDNTSGSAITMNSNHPLTLAGDFTFGGSNALNLGAGVTSLGANEQLARTITVIGTGGALTLGGPIINGSNAILPTTGLIKAGAGTLMLTGANSYTGETVINAGTVVATGGSGPQVTLTGTVPQSASTITGLSSTAGLVVGETVVGSNITAGSVIASIPNGTSIVLSAATGGTASTTEGVSFGAYGALGSGSTAVNGGTLVLNGSTAPNGSVVTVGNNTAVATLAGSGTVNGAVTTLSVGANVAHISPGSVAAPGTVGTLTIGNVGSFTVGNGTEFDYDLSNTPTTPGTSDLIAMTGGILTFSGTSTIFDFNALSSLSTSGSYTLINGAGSIVGFNASDFTATGLSGTLTATFSVVGGNLDVTFSPAGSGPTSAYFTGGTSADATSAANYVSSPTGGTISGAPAANTDVFFTANTSVTGTSVLTPNTNSGALDINSLTFTGTGTPATGSVVLSGSNAVTINAASGVGITVQTGAGNDTISAPVVLGNSQIWTVTDPGNTLTVSGTVSGGGFGITKTGSGTLALTGANTYSGGTHIAAGALFANNTNGSATGSGALVLDNGAILGGTGTITTTGANAINGRVLVGQATTSDLNTTSVLTMTSTGTTTFGATSNLVFNLNAATAGQGNELQTGPTSSVILTGGMTFTLNLLPATGGPIVPDPTQYVLMVGTTGSGLGGTSFFGSGVTDTGGVLSGLTLVINSSQGLGYYANSYLKLVGTNIDVEVVPEPGTWALMLGGLALMVVFQRSRRSKNN